MGPRPGQRPPPRSQASRANTLRLALCVLLLGPRPCAPHQAQCRDEEYPVGAECCPKCGPGYHVRQACKENTGTVCSRCPASTYTAHANGLSRCLPCRSCEPAVGTVTRRQCSSTQDAVCACSQGYFCEVEEEEHCAACLPHTTCRPGQRVQKKGTDSQDTVCADCPLGTFSPTGTLEKCLPWTKCMVWLEKEAAPGTNSTDVTCSWSWGFYFLLALFVLSLVVAVLKTCMWLRRKGQTGHATMAMASLQRKRQDESSQRAAAEAPPDVTTVAVEETMPVFREKDPGC